MRVRCCFSCFQFQIYENILLFRFNFFSSCVHFFLLPDCDCTTKLWACAFFSTWILCSAIIWIHYIKCFFASAKNPIIVRRDFQSTCIEDIKRIETPDLIYIFMQKKKQKKIRKCFKIKTGSQRFQVFERLWHPLVNWMNVWILISTSFGELILNDRQFLQFLRQMFFMCTYSKI